MNAITLNENSIKNNLYPFTLTRSVIDIRAGIFTLREKWEILSGKKIEILEQEGSLPANIIPTKQIIEELRKNNFESILSGAKKIENPWDIFRLNDEMIREDFSIIKKEKRSQAVSSTNKIISPENIFIEEDAIVEHCILNASIGPIYIGKNAEIMEGSMIRGPFALCENSIVKMGSKIYGATTIGKNCVVGGEIKNSVISDYSNKAHDGYLGDSVIGEWCNIGAGTSNSNIKNNATDTMVWNDLSNQFINAGLKCGTIMGDYSRCAINTSFNTGTIVGVCCNIFGNGLTPRNIRSFSWGFDGLEYEFEKAIKDITNWKKLKKQPVTDAEIRNLKHIFELSKLNTK
jgi:UDP-N-acetylglucosamine diphosphorylase/glucosamine-1-phosphate N-acetyltransferase